MKLISHILSIILTFTNINCQAQKLSAEVEIGKDSLMLNEEIQMVLIVKNLNLEPVSVWYDPRGNYHNELFRDATLEIELKDSLGNIIPQLESKQHEIIMRSGRVGYEELDQDEELQFPQWFNDWYGLRKSGKYTIRIKKTLECKSSNQLKSFPINVEAIKTIYFYKGGQQDYIDYIKELETKFINNEFNDYEEKRIVLETIIRSSSETSIDFFEKLLTSKNSYNASKAIRALGNLKPNHQASNILMENFKANFNNSIEETLRSELQPFILENLQLTALTQLREFPKEQTLPFLTNLINSSHYNKSIKEVASNIINTNKR